MLEDMTRICKTTLGCIIEADGSCIDDSSRSGVRKAAQLAQRGAEEEAAAAARKNQIDPRVAAKFEAMCDDVRNGKGLPFALQPVVEVDLVQGSAVGDEEEEEEEAGESTNDSENVV